MIVFYVSRKKKNKKLSQQSKAEGFFKVDLFFLYWKRNKRR